jgi:hypothetical protein
LLARPTQLTDTMVPTAGQIAGERHGEQKAREEERSRRSHPRGPIEYLGRYLPH